MAIAFDAVTDVAGTNTLAHTCTGANLVVFCCAFHDPTAGTITTATYGGVAMTELTRITQGVNIEVVVYYKAGPLTGAQNFVTAGTHTTPDLTAVSYTGASQTGIPDASASTTATASTSISQAITTIGDNSWQFAFLRCQGFSPTATGTPATLRTGGGGTGGNYFDSNAALTPAGSRTASFTASSTNWALITASFAPPGAAVTAKYLTLLGVGN